MLDKASDIVLCCLANHWFYWSLKGTEKKYNIYYENVYKSKISAGIGLKSSIPKYQMKSSWRDKTNLIKTIGKVSMEMMSFCVDHIVLLCWFYSLDIFTSSCSSIPIHFSVGFDIYYWDWSARADVFYQHNTFENTIKFRKYGWAKSVFFGFGIR